MLLDAERLISSKMPGSICLASARSAAPSVGLPLRLFTTPRPTSAEGSFWWSFERRVEIRAGLVEVALQHEHPAAVDIALGAFGLDLDHLVEVGDRQVVLLAHAIEIAALGVAVGEVRIELHLLVQLDKRPVEVALVAIDDAAQQEEIAVAWRRG